MRNLAGTRINHTTFITSDGYRLEWKGGEWTDGDMVFDGTLETGPRESSPLPPSGIWTDAITGEPVPGPGE